MRRSGLRPRVVVMLLGSLILVAAPFLARSPVTTSSVGEVPLAREASDAAPLRGAIDPLAPAPLPGSSVTAGAEQSPVGDPSPHQKVALPAAPVRLRIPAIGVDAVIVAVGLESDGAMGIPEDVATIGWYDPADLGGIRPGEDGTAVLSGHVDSRAQGRGALFDLRELALGDTITVEHDDGTVSRWTVNGRTVYAKPELPLEEIFTWSGPPRLALITCSGVFDRTARSYEDNIVVLAVPA
jgi:hypothetical protein